VQLPLKCWQAETSRHNQPDKSTGAAGIDYVAVHRHNGCYRK